MMPRVMRAVIDRLWQIDARELPWYRRAPIVGTRVAYAIGRDALQGELTLQAMGLVYTTLLALVPLIALSFSLLKGFGMHNVIEPALYQLLTPLGAQGHELAGRITAFVGNVNASVLGSVGVVFLLFTVVSMLQKVEGAFNRIWQVRRGRLLLRRFTDYLGVVIIGPVLLVGALGLTATVSHLSVLDQLTGNAPATFVAHVAPYALAIAAFWFVYVFAPNTRVKLGPAFIGAVVAGIAWQTAGLAFTLFTTSTTRVTVIYSGFAIVIFALMWLYLSWLILLSGAKIAFYVQNPAFVSRFRFHRFLGSRLREKLALKVMVEVGRNFLHRETAPSINTLTRCTGASGEVVANVCNQLNDAGVLRVADGGYIPGGDMSDLSLDAVVLAVRHFQSRSGELELRLQYQRPIEQVSDAIDGSIATATRRYNLRELVLEVDACRSKSGDLGRAATAGED